jgi:hypothetical protein
MLKTLVSITDDKGVWSAQLARKAGLSERLEGMSIMNAGRLVEPLLAYARLTGNSEAERLAVLYARQGLSTGFDSEGRFTPIAQSSGHIHSITSTLSGIADYATHRGDMAMLAACEKILRHGVPEYFSSWGWGEEVMPEHPAYVTGRGEINQTGDVIRTALLLGEAVDPDWFELAERYLRSMVLPTQHREAEMLRFLRDNPTPKDDSERNVLRRSIGGFSMQLPNDRMRKGDWPISTLDITSGAVHALCESVRHMLQSSEKTTRLNLLFSCANDQFEIRSHLPLEGRIEFLSKGGGILKIRIPPWVNQGSVRLTIRREPATPRREGAYLVVHGLRAGDQGELQFDVPCRMEREIVDDTEYTTKWVGNQIVEIAPRGKVSPLPF